MFDRGQSVQPLSLVGVGANADGEIEIVEVAVPEILEYSATPTELLLLHFYRRLCRPSVLYRKWAVAVPPPTDIAEALCGRERECVRHWRGVQSRHNFLKAVCVYASHLTER